MSINNFRRNTVNHNPGGELECQLQIGSRVFPEYPIRSHNEAYYQLKRTLGVQASVVHNFDISHVQCRDINMILGIDCEKVVDAGFIGIKTRIGDLMSVEFKYNSKGSADIVRIYTRLAYRIHIVLRSDQILEIRDRLDLFLALRKK